MKRNTEAAPIRFDLARVVGAVRDYNADSYRGRLNVDIDRAGYELFRDGVPSDEDALVELVRFVGEDYGGAQRRFLPHDYGEEAKLIVRRLLPVLDRWRSTVETARPLTECVPEKRMLVELLEPFEGTKKWPVWASKTLHFFRPDVFPILDSRAKIALGIRNLGSSPRDYHRFCEAFRRVLIDNDEALAAAREVDGGASPSDLKLLDKILYQLGE